jgi:hypothetical protein
MECKTDFNKGYFLSRYDGDYDDGEYQFCCKECHDTYIHKHGQLPLGIIDNYMC